MDILSKVKCSIRENENNVYELMSNVKGKYYNIHIEREVRVRPIESFMAQTERIFGHFRNMVDILSDELPILDLAKKDKIIIAPDKFVMTNTKIAMLIPIKYNKVRCISQILLWIYDTDEKIDFTLEVVVNKICDIYRTYYYNAPRKLDKSMVAIKHIYLYGITYDSKNTVIYPHIKFHV